ncbi:MAG TPA: hypothetical protein VGA36_10140 [Nitriliruptorales bacterium]|jgi:hypothetical protein
MAVDEQRRSHAYERLAAAVGEEAAVTLFELLPPPNTKLATGDDIRLVRADVDLVRADVELLGERLDHRFALVGQRVEQVDQRFEQLDQRFDDFSAMLRAEMGGMRGELMAAFHSEIAAAVSSQTRSIIVANATTLAAMAGLAMAISQLG